MSPVYEWWPEMGVTSYLRVPDGPLQELRPGAWVEVNGERLRVVSLSIKPAEEDDPEMGVMAGDPITTVEFSRVP